MSPQCRWCSTWADDPVHRPPFVPGSGHHPFEEDVDWEARYRSLVAALWTHQWDGVDEHVNGCCPICYQFPVEGHNRDCWLAALLADAAPETPR